MPTELEQRMIAALKRREWTPEDDQRLATIYEQTSSVRAASAALGRTRGAVDARITRLGIPRHKYKHPKNSEHLHLRLNYDLYQRLSIAADRLGISKNAAFRYFLLQGLAAKGH